MERDGVTLMLEEGADEDGPPEGRGRGVSFYILCEDADSIYTELTSRGVELRPPVVAYYGMKQVIVPEPDGYFLCFESPVTNSGKLTSD
jgi:uncharacterized glyoxalase superfamily protein PhnB